MIRCYHAIVFLLWISGSYCHAEGVEFFLYQPHAYGPQYLLPRWAEETPEAAARRYEGNIRVAFPQIAARYPMPNSWGTFPVPQDLRQASRPSLALLMNRLSNMGSDDSPTAVQQVFRRYGANVFLIPVAAELALGSTLEARQRFHKGVIAQFDALVALGGQDISPKLYGQAPEGAINFSTKRDRFEVALVQSFVKARQGVMYGICRGHQLCAAALGHELIQDYDRPRCTQILPGALQERRYSLPDSDKSYSQEICDGRRSPYYSEFQA